MSAVMLKAKPFELTIKEAWSQLQSMEGEPGLPKKLIQTSFALHIT